MEDMPTMLKQHYKCDVMCSIPFKFNFFSIKINEMTLEVLSNTQLGPWCKKYTALMGPYDITQT